MKTEIKEEQEANENVENVNAKGKTDFLEYMTRNDGSVVCKLCGEILQSRTHWYRHKYKLHVVQPLNPAPLFQCEQCLVFFKSRKGYIGHIASRHSETLSDSHPVISSSQLEAAADGPSAPSHVKIEPVDPELAIPKSTLPNYNSSAANSTNRSLLKSSAETKKLFRPMKTEQATNQSDWEEKRSREEKLVADIIDRVRRECEAQGAGGAARRGYTRRTTVMNT
ncbi:hypothetical protein EVAR_95369_1 [Eumeta japonica]|uniref:C2H2-type domain-containing protein n=1 Tax=Eumeta variegata TaxID=151549 RepID=A0A4C1U9J0_EUMVA|nr:hypothetical protein EVAR_95369_1 [Eumeta japonica]